MKKKIFTLGIACVAAVSAMAQVEVKSNYFDAYVDETGFVNDFGDMLLINNGTAETPKKNCAVMNFLLPGQYGTTVTAASFKATVVRRDAVDFNGDLYGINVRESDKAEAGDYYSGPFVSGENCGNNADWGIMASFLNKDNVPQGNPISYVAETDAAANEQLRQFIQKQYDNEGVNKYAFLRINIGQETAALWQRYAIASEANAANAPVLTLTFQNGPGTGIDLIPNSGLAFSAYDGRIHVESDASNENCNVNIYNVSGALVANGTINNGVFVSENLPVNQMYIVEVNQTRHKLLVR